MFAFLVAMLVVVAGLALQASSAAARNASDLPDEVAGQQIHAVYALPSDGADRQLDTNGTIANEIASFQGWLAAQTGGATLWIDRAGGGPDVTFLRLSRTDSEIQATGAFVRDAIEAELHAAGIDAPEKIYAVWYEGGSTFACGGGAYPPSLPGDVAAMYLGAGCGPFAPPGGPPGYLQFAMLHEIMHTIGIVPDCAPHQVRAGHASDSPTDLMYAGDEPWNPSVLDFGRDDYFRSGIPNCLDLATSGWLTPVPDPGPAPSSTSPNAGSQPRPAARDGTGPVLRLSARRNRHALKLGAVSVVVRCPSEPCTVVATGTVSVRGRASAHYRLRSATRRIPRGGSAKLRLRFPRSALTAVRRSVAKRRIVKAKLRITASDAAGNGTVRRRTIKLTRR